jgi:hypothetical protein
MERNVGLTDAGIRIIAGIVIAILGIYLRSWLGLIAIIPIVTGLIGYCPLYKLLGLNSFRKKFNR